MYNPGNKTKQKQKQKNYHKRKIKNLYIPEAIKAMYHWEKSRTQMLIFVSLIAFKLWSKIK